jgi:hypothetical protein
MSKILVLAVALSIVLGSGAFFYAQADCGIHFPSVCGSCDSARDKDLASMDRGLKGNNDWERDVMNAPVSPY